MSCIAILLIRSRGLTAQKGLRVSQTKTSANFHSDTNYESLRACLVHSDERMERIGASISALDQQQATLIKVLQHNAVEHFPMLTEAEWLMILNVTNFNRVDEFLINIHRVMDRPVLSLATMILNDGSHSVPQRIENLTTSQELACLFSAMYFWTKDTKDTKTIEEVLAIISRRRVEDVFLTEV